MPVRPLGKRFQVTVERAAAKEGYRRIRRSVPTFKEGQELEAEIITALDAFGYWPVEPEATPLDEPLQSGQEANTATYRNPDHRTGTLREAMKLALETHWKGMRTCRSNEYLLHQMVYFLERRGKYDIDMLRSPDIDAYVAQCHVKGLEVSSINQHLSAFRVVNKVALKRLPPLATVMIPTPFLKGAKKEKWWLRPEQHEEVVSMLRKPGGDPLFADLIDTICYQGLRVEEALRLEERHFMGLNSDRPWLKPAGTKTDDAQNSIPVYPEAIPVVKRAIYRANENRWAILFPITYRQAMERWNLVRDHLGVIEVPTATMKALRRTFAWYANSKGMPTSTLQKAMRHKDIKTTSGYLDLIGNGDLDRSREYFAPDPTPLHTPRSNVGEIIKAYASSGASPEDVARFAKELMV